MSIKKMLLAVGLAIGLMLSGRASAQEIPQGPFLNGKHLANAWLSFVPSQAATVYLDGQVVFTRSGGGPAVGGWYFTCPSDTYVRTNCPTEGPFLNISSLIDYWSQFAPSNAAYIYLDNQLVYYRSGFGPAVVRYFYTCYSRPGGGLMTNCSL